MLMVDKKCCSVLINCSAKEKIIYFEIGIGLMAYKYAVFADIEKKRLHK